VREAATSRWSTSELLNEVDWTLLKIEERRQSESDGVMILADGFGLDHEHGSSSISATTLPFGNPPATYEVAVAFTVGDSLPLRLLAIEMMLTNAGVGLRGRLTLETENGGVPSGSVVCEWGIDMAAAGSVHTLFRVEPPSPVALQPGGNYWICLYATTPSTELRLLGASTHLAPRRAVFAERDADNPWTRKVSKSGPGFAVRVLGKPSRAGS